MCKKFDDTDLKRQLLDKNIDLIQAKGEAWNQPLGKMFEAAFVFSQESYKQEISREKRITTSANINLVILGFLVTAYITFYSSVPSFDCNLASKILLLVGFGILCLNLAILLLLFTYKRKRSLDSPIDSANSIMEEYVNNKDMENFNNDKEHLTHANFIKTIQSSFHDLETENNRRVIYLKISNIVTFVVIILIVVAICIFKK